MDAHPQATAWRLDLNTSFKEALVAEGKPGNSSVRAIERRMARERRQVLLGKASRRITGRGSRQAIFQAECTGPDGSTMELHDQISMVHAMAASNLSRQQQCLKIKGTPYLSCLVHKVFRFQKYIALLFPFTCDVKRWVYHTSTTQLMLFMESCA